MTLTRFGFREWGIALLVTLVVEAACFYLCRRGYPVWGISIGVVMLLFFLAFAAFFRNPHREIPGDPRLILSPADGVIRDIEVVEEFALPPFTGRALRIGIFLSVLDVHVNRAPADMTVESTNYRPGEYLDARHNEASRRNEAMTIAGTAEVDGRKFPLAVRQISGAIARRIVCPVDAGRKLKRGEIYGMIKFGSRTELYLPETGFTISAKVGDRVYGGMSVLARVDEGNGEK